MGSFMGHVVPGTFFTCFGMWWLYNVFFRYFYAKRFRPLSYRNTSRFSCQCSSRCPIESLFKIISMAIGMMGEFFTGFDGEGKWTHWGNAQHMTMYFFFGINGLVDLLQHKKWDLPPKLDYLSAIIAFSIEGFLFYNHLHDRKHMDIMVHMFLFQVIVCCVVSTFVEMQHPKSVVAALARAFFVLLQGTWFFQIGFILYPPVGDKWNEDSHEEMMIVTLIFAWHVAALLVIMFGFGILIHARVQNLKGTTMNYQLVETNEGSQSKEKHHHSNGYSNSTNSTNIIDSDSEEV